MTLAKIKHKAISRFGDDDHTGPKQQMEEQKAVMICDISLYSASPRVFVLMRNIGSRR